MMRSWLAALGAMAWSANAMALEPVDLVGTWNVTLAANYSSCSNTNVGEINAQQWIVSWSGEEFSVTAVGSGAGDVAYRGVLVDGKSAVRFYIKEDSKRLVTVDLTGDATALTGRRVSAWATPCATIWDVTAKKQ